MDSGFEGLALLALAAFVAGTIDALAGGGGLVRPSLVVMWLVPAARLPVQPDNPLVAWISSALA